MDKNIEIYLEKIARNLHLSETDKKDVIAEIRNHIYEAINRQEPSESVIKKLGEPTKLAKSYNHSYKLENDDFKFTDVLNSLAFYSSVAISGIFIVTTLPIFSITFFLTSIFIFGLTITNLIGLTHLPFNVGFMPDTGASQVIIGVVVSVILLLLSYVSWSGLKKYIKFVTNNYRKRRVH